MSEFTAGRNHAVPARAQTFGMLLFLLGLTIVFASGMVLYVIFRLWAPGLEPLGEYRPQMANWKLFLSTAIVLLASFAVHRTLRAVQRERHGTFRTWLWVTNALAILFLIVQTPAIVQLLSLDPAVGAAPLQVAEPRASRLWAVLFLFVLLHAAHVIGGIIYLAVVTVKAYRGFYDHEHYVGVRHAALYWHFLDAVWIVMFGTFLVLG